MQNNGSIKANGTNMYDFSEWLFENYNWIELSFRIGNPC